MRANGVERKFSDANRIIEVDDERLAAMGMIDSPNDVDMKYQLFCKWLQQNEQNDQPKLPNDKFHNDDRSQLSAAEHLTEDEVSSFATNSDDSGSDDIFLDTETDFPLIVLSRSDDDTAQMPLDSFDGIESPLGGSRVNTPSQLSVSDFDCSSSEATVNSRISATSGTSSQTGKRKAKHKKGRAPAIPTLANVTNTSGDQSSNIELIKSISATEIPFISKSARETDI